MRLQSMMRLPNGLPRANWNESTLPSPAKNKQRNYPACVHGVQGLNCATSDSRYSARFSHTAIAPGPRWDQA